MSRAENSNDTFSPCTLPLIAFPAYEGWGASFLFFFPNRKRSQWQSTSHSSQTLMLQPRSPRAS
nr:MAG TPA: hypothetical protein [Herelleviridae sp.]